MDIIYTDNTTIQLVSTISAADIHRFYYRLEAQFVQGSFSSFFRVATAYTRIGGNLALIGTIPERDHDTYHQEMSRQEHLFLNNRWY